MASDVTGRLPRWIASSLVALGISGGLPAAVDDPPEQELRAVRSRIEALQRGIGRDMERRDALTARLRDTELLAASVSRNLEALRAERRSSEARREAMAAERGMRLLRLADEREALVRQLRLAYANGRQERLKLLLTQEDAALIGRLMVYYRYLSQHRAERIGLVHEQLVELERLEQRVAAEAARLRDLERQRSEELEALEAARQERKRLVAALDERIREQDAEMAEMRARETALVELLDELRQVFADFPVQAERPFADLKGELAWPIDGSVLADFGEQRAGRSLKWNGVLLAAQRGTPVRAIANGRVAYADWLPGMGLLVVVEHGDGYMSLYGHHDSLNKTAGDWVSPGEVLGTVGDTGGQARPALYFEIRQGRVPRNPHPWFKQRLAGR